MSRSTTAADRIVTAMRRSHGADRTPQRTVFSRRGPAGTAPVDIASNAAEASHGEC